MNYDKQFTAWLEENRQQLIEDWMALARIPSIQSEPLPGAPYGAACAQAVDFSAALFAARDIPVRTEADLGYALAQVGQGEKSICLFGHSDVVPTGDGWLFTQPFDPVIKDGHLIGRGVSDNKSGIIASLCVLAMLRDLNIPIRSRVQAFIGSNEESGMGDISSFVAKEKMPDLCLIPDANFPCGLGEKGILRMWAKCCAKLTAVEYVKGGDAFNVVLDYAEAKLLPNAALAAELQNKCTEEYTLRVEEDGIYVSAKGLAKHAAAPDGSVNAAWLMAKLLASCENLPEQDRAIFGTVEAFLASHWGEGMDIAHQDGNFGRLTAVCGMVAVEDGHLKVSIDSRYGTECDPVTLERRLYSAWEEAGWQITYMNNRPGYLVDKDSPIPGLFSNIYSTMSGREKPLYYMAGGTYARYLKNAFTVGNRTRHADWTTAAMEMPAGHGGAHQRDESIGIEDFFLAVRILAQYVLECDRLLAEQ